MHFLWLSLYLDDALNEAWTESLGHVSPDSSECSPSHLQMTVSYHNVKRLCTHAPNIQQIDLWLVVSENVS